MTNPSKAEIRIRRVQVRSGGEPFYEARLVQAGADAADVDPGEVICYRRSFAAAKEAALVERARREARADLFAANLAFLSEEAPLPVAEKKIVGLFRARRKTS